MGLAPLGRRHGNRYHERGNLPRWHPVVDLFDSSTKQLVWRGWATDALPDDPKKEAKKLDKDIEKLFKNFTPK